MVVAPPPQPPFDTNEIPMTVTENATYRDRFLRMVERQLAYRPETVTLSEIRSTNNDRSYEVMVADADGVVSERITDIEAKALCDLMQKRQEEWDGGYQRENNSDTMALRESRHDQGYWSSPSGTVYAPSSAEHTITSSSSSTDDVYRGRWYVPPPFTQEDLALLWHALNEYEGEDDAAIEALMTKIEEQITEGDTE